MERAFSPMAFERAILAWLMRRLPTDFAHLYKSNPQVKHLINIYFKLFESTLLLLLAGLFPFSPPYLYEHAHPLPFLVFLLSVIIGIIALAYTSSIRVANGIVVGGTMLCVFLLSVMFGGITTQMSRHGIIVFFFNVLYGNLGIGIGIAYNVLSTFILYQMELNGYDFNGTRSPEEMTRIFSIHSLYLNFSLLVIMASYERKYSQIIADIAKANQYKTEFLCRMSHELRYVLAMLFKWLLDVKSDSDSLMNTAPINQLFSEGNLTPLVGIVGAIDILDSAKNITPDQLKLIQIARNCASNLLGIINDVLDFSKIEAQMMKLHVESVNLKELVDTCAQVVSPLISANPKVQLKVKFDASKLPQKFLGDSLRIRQVLINLLSNAIKFTEQGTITVKVSLRRSLGTLPWTSSLSPRPQILRVPSSVFSKRKLLTTSAENDFKIESDEVNKPKTNGYLVFSVQDTGIGIEKDNMLKIFDAFEQGNSDTSTKYGGSGLGLAISKRICILHGGDIAVMSPGKDEGTTFFFYIPYHEIPSEDLQITASVEYFNENPSQDPDLSPDYRMAPIPRVPNQKQTALINSYKNAASPSLRESFEKPAKMSLLLAEDNKVNQLVIKAMLKKMNCNVDIANNGREAVEKTKEKHYDLIFMDIEMPEMNGLEAASILQQRSDPTPIVALTAHALAETREEALKTGMKEVITKPCTFEQLQTVCDKYVGMQNQR